MAAAAGAAADAVGDYRRCVDADALSR